QVDGADYIVVDSLPGTVTPGLSGGWTLGDGNFDGMITGADYLPIDSNFGSGIGNPLAVLDLQPLGVSPVPIAPTVTKERVTKERGAPRTPPTPAAIFADEDDWRDGFAGKKNNWDGDADALLAGAVWELPSGKLGKSRQTTSARDTLFAVDRE
ncbi:MAG: hypothetical protein SFX18_19100, partial [Pirellulales bacterium]|nr:hypothetical protein [Pirellulales bacterium]